MGLFSKAATPITTEPDYQDVVDYLRDLSQQDYTKILKVVGIYRDADKGVKKVLNIKEVEPHINHVQPKSFLDDDDTELGNFLEDELPKKVVIQKTPKAKTKKGKGEN